MIHIQILKSPDVNVITEFKYYLNQLYLGRGQGDLSIQDPDLHRSELMIEVLGSELLVHPQKDVDHYLINGKRATEIRKIKIGERITIGKTEFKILAFAETPTESKKALLDAKMAKHMQEGSDRLEVIEKLVKLSQ